MKSKTLVALLCLWAGSGLARADSLPVTLDMSGVGQFLGSNGHLAVFALDGTATIPQLGFVGLFFSGTDSVIPPSTSSQPFAGNIYFLSGPNILDGTIVVPAGVLEPGLGSVPSFYGDIYIRAGSGSLAGASGMLSLTLDSWHPQGPHRAMFTMTGTGDLNLPVPEPANGGLIGLAVLLVAVPGFIKSTSRHRAARPAVTQSKGR